MTDNNIELSIKMNNNIIFNINININNSIKELKEKIKKLERIPIYCQKLYYNNVELFDDKKFYNYNFKNSNVENIIELLNLNELYTTINIKNKKIILKYYLRASDTVLNLKKIIFGKENIPIDKIKIFNSNKIIEDINFIEDFIDNLNFNKDLLKINKIKLNIINGDNLEKIYVDPFYSIDELYNLLNINFDYRLKFNNEILYFGKRKLLIQYNIKDDDYFEIIKLDSNVIKLKIKIGGGGYQNVTVNIKEPIYILMDILNIEDANVKFVYNGITYAIGSIRTFEKIGLTEDTTLFLFSEAISG